MTSKRKTAMMDGNEAAAYVAFRTNEVCAIYPITPSSSMGEHADAWSANGLRNIWKTVPVVAELQSEGGASGSVHGALQGGALTTTFTASQGLLLMIPNMFKIAGELTSTVFHVSARSVACQALSIFGDHSDVMAVRGTGFGLLSSNSIQEVMDFALISQAVTLEARVPFIHFFDGFRTSHEIMKVELLSEDDMYAMISEDLVIAHRQRAMNPEKPVLRGTSQNPDVFFQARETVNPYYSATPGIVQKAMDKFAGITGRQYKLFDYVGDPKAEKIIVQMGSGAEVADETVEYLVNKGEKVGLVKVRLYRPFSGEHFVNALPETVKSVAVLDRTKEPGSLGEPLYLDCCTALSEAGRDIKVTGGRYGLSSKEYTPAMVKGVFDELSKDSSKKHFTVGIKDDVSNLSINYDSSFDIESKDTVRCMFYGLGSDGTVSANKNSIKIIGEDTDNFAQGYFVYDSKKAGAITVSHLRFGPMQIRQTCLINSANFVGCHQAVFMEKYDVLAKAAEGAVFLLNTQHGPDDVWDTLPKSVQQTIIDKKLKFYVIDAYKVAKKTGMGVRINTIMQTCFFAISGILPREQAIQAIKKAIKKAYGTKGEQVVKKNFEAVDQSIAHLNEVNYPQKVTSSFEMPPVVSNEAPEFVKEVTATIMRGQGDELPVSKMPPDGTYPTATTQWEKRNIALEIPVWEPDVCIQCAKCSAICPHAAIRVKAYSPDCLKNAPKTFKSVDAKGGPDFKDLKWTVQVAPEDCTGCGLCVHVCPGKDKQNPSRKAINMSPQPPVRFSERDNFKFFLDLPEFDRTKLNRASIKGSQLMRPLFEYSGACAGCGETPYVKLLTQLFGDRALIANATGCSSIYGGNLPTTPYAVNDTGQGPAWNNSLFEDAAEVGYGLRLAVDKHTEQAAELVQSLGKEIGSDLVESIMDAKQVDEVDIAAQRERVEKLKANLKGNKSSEAKQLLSLVDDLVKRSVWIIGGDGWAYDIGYGGLDHVLASGRNVNILVVDTEVYSNTGGQCSKATPRGAIAKFAAAGKPLPKKDLCMIAMTYQNIYVARVAIGANDNHTARAFVEAEAYNGPSLIVAYSHCIAHGINMGTATDQQKAAVATGYWPLMRFNPDKIAQGENPLTLDSKAPTMALEDYIYKENRYLMLTKTKPEVAKQLLKLAQEDVAARWKLYEQMAKFDYSK
ncbi:MAG: pyruvate:ferredoxin (flavodoxin) oxidoreductase [Candidatus Theseobacter exili]|nr:pyruvate:ferredoxin (flavodoxin) oxidoreductase [Candidatus Theseobacter exili]